jgi:dTDP-4-amino-4,6-dideoxygalactose transaminase
MNIPIIDLRAQYEAIKSEINSKVLSVLETQNFILGKEVAALEEEIAAYSGAGFAVGVSSGSDAILVSLMALGIGAADAVITTPFTFFATAGAIARLGARPVFCDIDPETWNIDPAAVEAAVRREKKAGRLARLKAVLPVHLYGQCADMSALLRTARRHGLWVVEDAAQAIGSEYPMPRGPRKAGAMGTMGTLSFYPSKNLGGYGDGGMVLTSSKKLADRLRILRVHGGVRKYRYRILGGNFRLDALQAAVLRVKFRHLEDWQRKRRERASTYDRKIAESGLTDTGLVVTPAAVYRGGGLENSHTYHQYVIRASSRNRLQGFLREKGVGTSIFYPLPLHEQKCFSYLGYKRGDFPAAEKAAREVLALPMFPELTPEQQDYVVGCLREFYAGSY